MAYTDAEILDRIHANSMRMLSELGIAFHSEEALAILRAHGVRTEGLRAYFTEQQVMDALAMTTKAFTIHARNPRYDMHINTESLYVTPGYGSASITEADGSVRTATFDDFLRLANIVQRSDEFCINGGILAQPGDLDADIASPAMVYATIKRSDKVVFSVSADKARTVAILDLLGIAFGKENFKANPHSVTLISTMSPLGIDENALDTLLLLARHAQPVCIAPGPMAGGTGPISLAGNISLANAEILGVNVLCQLVCPGMPLIYGFAATTSDMHNMSVCNASPGFVKEARYGALMAKRYGLACRSGGGMSDAGGLTAQAGAESAMSLFESFSEKANFVMHATGSLQSFSTVNYEKFMLDLETIARMRYYFSPLDCSDEALAFDALQGVICEDEQFMFSEHTLERCRVDPFFNTVSLHGRSRGEPNTELYVSCRAKLAYELDQYVKPPLDADVERQLDDYM